MYSRKEASRIREEFWTSFGLYMQPVASADGERINWINYKTGEPNLSFRMDAGRRSASIAIELSHPDPGVQELYYEQFAELRKIFEATMEEAWHWQKLTSDDNARTISRISTTLPDVSVFNKEDWPAIIGFLKPRIIRLDEFWSNVRYAFESLR